MTRYRLAAAWVGVQVVFFAGWAVVEASRLDEGEGQSIWVGVVPVDPRDILRGQYMRFGYEFSAATLIPADARSPDGRTVWVVLSPQGSRHVPTRGSGTRPERLSPGEVAVRGRLERSRITYGIERYFVPEGTPTPAFEDLLVRLRVGDDGRPRIEEVLLNGTPWP